MVVERVAVARMTVARGAIARSAAPARARVVAIALAVFGVALIAGCATSPSERTLREAAESLDGAIRDRDRTRLERLVASDFVQVRGGGQRVERERYIRDLVDTPVAPGAYVPSVDLVQVSGRTGIVAGRIEYLRPDAPPLVARYANTWLFRDRAWQVVFEQLALVPDGPAPR